ncbi:MAG: SDR family oxidoreductase [Gemmataceae bacterium]|nr:SDR family oxidoreductase [Gemmataceae bacterium]
MTGGYGFFGSWIVRDLAAAKHSTTILDLRQDNDRLTCILPADLVEAVKFQQGNVTDSDSIIRAIRDNGITHVIHLAGLQVPTCRANPVLGAQVNVLGTLAVFEAYKACRDQVQRVVYASSAAVFGPPGDYPAGKIHDEVRLSPSTHYGFYKICNEGNAKVYFLEHGLTSIGLRPWTVYGVGRDVGMTSEPTKAMKCMALGRPYHISYGGKQDLQFVADVARIFVRSLEAPFQGAKAYNLRGDIVDMAQLHQVFSEVEPQAARLITFGEKQIPIAFDLSDDSLQTELGPFPGTPLVEGVRRTIKKFKKLESEGRLDKRDLD